MSEEKVNIDLGDFHMENILGDQTTKFMSTINASCSTIKLNVNDEKNNKNFVIGYYLMIMDEKDLDNIKVDNDNLSQDTLICINEFQIPQLITIISGMIDLSKSNNAFEEATDNTISDIIIEYLFREAKYIRMSRYIDIINSKIKATLSFLKLNDKPLERFIKILKVLPFISQTEFDNIYNKCMKQFEEETGKNVSTAKGNSESNK